MSQMHYAGDFYGKLRSFFAASASYIYATAALISVARLCIQRSLAHQVRSYVGVLCPAMVLHGRIFQLPTQVLGVPDTVGQFLSGTPKGCESHADLSLHRATRTIIATPERL
ncbi:hypothetical protein EJ03DRAFT_150789 [Teratosphaeria nubilosa]|uniref:Uncharacterized protein n=1 Tax=Teratosphaeria nubilosa TaxID=161662 RepID=A0A6G1LLD9_9PEZI|nr:hypothetical protein EJ03DRAFT_150789 [Teratosphaeria nubilosa]